MLSGRGGAFRCADNSAALQRVAFGLFLDRLGRRDPSASLPGTDVFQPVGDGVERFQPGAGLSENSPQQLPTDVLLPRRSSWPSHS